MAKEKNIEIFHRRTNQIKYTVKNETGNSVYGDISEFEMYFTVEDTDSGDIVIEKRNSNAGGSDLQIDMTGEEDSYCLIIINVSDTKGLEANKYYSYEITAKLPTGEVKTLTYGSLFLRKSIGSRF